MYLHLGAEVVVPNRDIIGIFDLDNTTVSPHTKGFLQQAEAAGQVKYVSYELPKGFVVCASRGEQHDKQRVYITQMAPVTLKKRADRGRE